MDTQSLLQALKMKRDELISSAKQFGQGYMSTPQPGQSQSPQFQAGQGVAMMPPTSGVGAGDDVTRMAIGMAGQVKPKLTEGVLKSLNVENHMGDLLKLMQRSPNNPAYRKAFEIASKLAIQLRKEQ